MRLCYYNRVKFVRYLILSLISYILYIIIDDRNLNKFLLFFAECRMAGTANDYIGTLSTTRSGRTCAKWSNDYVFEQIQRSNASLKIEFPPRTIRSFRAKFRWKHHLPMKEDILSIPSQLLMKSLSNLSLQSEFITVKPVHFVDRTYLNDSLYPEHSVRDANNYCRNPSRNIAGTWCYTTNPLVPQDLCNVRDCEKPGKISIIA